jgi:tetratricopeptide (TPR) repeat protein
VLPDDPQLRNSLAEALRGQNRLTEAVALYRGVTDPGPDDLHNLGSLRAQLGDVEGGLADYRRALQADPEMRVVHYSMGGLLLLLDRYAESARAYETYLAGPSPNATLARRARERLDDVYRALGARQIAAGDLPGADETYRKLEAIGGMTAPAWHNVAMVRGRKGDVGGAVEACVRAIAMDPTFAPAYLTLARVYDERGDRGAAVEHYRAFLARWTKEDGMRRMAEERIRNLR